jgi:DNA-directed RNA polymerase omega subunit
MINRDRIGNLFEFTVVAGARARQLLRGATPRVEPSEKRVVTAQRETLAGAIRRVDADDRPPE